MKTLGKSQITSVLIHVSPYVDFGKKMKNRQNFFIFGKDLTDFFPRIFSGKNFQKILAEKFFPRIFSGKNFSGKNFQKISAEKIFKKFQRKKFSPEFSAEKIFPRIFSGKNFPQNFQRKKFSPEFSAEKIFPRIFGGKNFQKIFGGKFFPRIFPAWCESLEGKKSFQNSKLSPNWK